MTKDETLKLAVKALLEIVQSGSECFEIVWMDCDQKIHVLKFSYFLVSQSRRNQGNNSNCRKRKRS